MEAILERLAALEKEVAILKGECKGPDGYSFKEAINSICVTEHDLSLVYNSSMKKQILRLLVEFNKKTPFLKWKRVLYKYEEEWQKLTDEDVTYMIENIENSIIVLYKKVSKELKPEEFFETAEIIYGLDLNKNFKKIKAELFQSL